MTHIEDLRRKTLEQYGEFLGEMASLWLPDACQYCPAYIDCLRSSVNCKCPAAPPPFRFFERPARKKTDFAVFPLTKTKLRSILFIRKHPRRQEKKPDAIRECRSVNGQVEEVQTRC